MIETIASGLVLAMLSGMTYLAYKHPDGFRWISCALIPPILILTVFYIIAKLGGIHGGIRLLGKEAARSSGDKVEVLRFSIESLNDDLTTLYWVAGILLAALAYLVFLWFMPQILGLQKKKNTQPKEGHVSSESTSSS